MESRTKKVLAALAAVVVVTGVAWFVMQPARFQCQGGQPCQVVVRVKAPTPATCSIEFVQAAQLHLRMPPGSQPGGKDVVIRWILNNDPTSSGYEFKADGFALKSGGLGPFREAGPIAGGRTYQVVNPNQGGGTYEYGLKVHSVSGTTPPRECLLDPFIYNFD